MSEGFSSWDRTNRKHRAILTNKPHDVLFSDSFKYSKNRAIPHSLVRFPADLSYCQRLLIVFNTVEVDHSERVSATGSVRTSDRRTLREVQRTNQVDGRAQSKRLGGSTLGASKVHPNRRPSSAKPWKFRH